MDLLEYTKEDLEKLSTKELEELYHQCEMMQEQKSTGQLTKKVLINGLYGALANKAFVLFNEKIAQSITGNGRYFIQKTANMIEDSLQSKLPQPNKYVVYGDTDSVYYQIDPYVNLYLTKNHSEELKNLKTLTPEQELALKDKCIDFCDSFAENVVQGIIDTSIEQMAHDFNAYDKSRIGAKREVIADKGVYIAKKKYLLRVRVDEGTRFPIDAPHTKVMGLEIAKSTTPKWVKDKLNGSIEVILDSDIYGLRKYIDNIRTEYMDVPLEDISAVLSSTNVSPYNPGENKVFGRTIAGAYNRFITENDLLGKFTEIQPTEKYKYLFLVPQNPFGTEAIAYNSASFAEEYIRPYIDYDKTFEKTFMASLKNMTDALNYRIDSSSDLDDEDW